MKYGKLYIQILIISILSSCYSCNYKQKNDLLLLQQAQQIVSSSPAEALVLLDSIWEPEKMDKDLYMQYVVAHIQAKYKCYKDITNDTLIFGAREYFETKENKEQSAFANFYCAWYSFEKKEFGKTLTYFSKAKAYALQADNQILAANSTHNIAYTYFTQNVMDSAIVYYKQALACFEGMQSVDTQILKTLNYLGRSFQVNNQLDSSFYYYNRGLDLAKERDDEANIAAFNQDLSVVYRLRGDFKQAKEYLFKALPITKDSGDSLRIYINLALIYSNQQQVDSSKVYVDKIKNRIPSISYKPTIRLAYSVLSDYYKRIGNIPEAFRYKELQQDISNEILKTQNIGQLIQAKNDYDRSVREKEIENQRLWYILITSTVLFLLIVIFYTISIKRKHRVESERSRLDMARMQAENEALKTKGELIGKEGSHLELLLQIYEDVITKQNKYKRNANLNDIINGQFTGWGKEMLQSIPEGDRAVQVLSNDEILLIHLRYLGYTEKQINIICGSKFHPSQLDGIKAKLQSIGISEGFIDQIINSRF